MDILFLLSQVVFVSALSPLAVGVVRKMKARMQNRVGASVLQPYRDLWKLFHKDEVISADASWIFRFSPYLIFAVMLVVAGSVPVIAALSPVSFSGGIPGTEPLFFVSGDFLVVMYLLMLSTFFLALAGMDTGSAFGGFGASREMMVTALAEGGMLCALFAASMAGEAGNLMIAVGRLQTISLQAYLPLGVAFLGFFLALLAENKRFPVDNPATHLELTMIHEAMTLEYSGKRLALLEWAAANKLLIFVALGANVFFPWGVATEMSPNAVAFSIVLLVVKTTFFLGAIAFLESTMAKFRIFRVPDLLFTSFVLGVIALGMLVTL